MWKQSQYCSTTFPYFIPHFIMTDIPITSGEYVIDNDLYSKVFKKFNDILWKLQQIITRLFCWMCQKLTMVIRFQTLSEQYSVYWLNFVQMLMRDIASFQMLWGKHFSEMVIARFLFSVWGPIHFNFCRYTISWADTLSDMLSFTQNLLFTNCQSVKVAINIII